MYDGLLLAAVLWAAGLFYVLFEGHFDVPHSRSVFQAYLALVSAAYFTAQWTHGGQTLAMRSWNIRVMRQAGGEVDLRMALVRYLAALFSVVLFGAGFLWALVDRERQFLHDRLAGTLIVMAVPHHFSNRKTDETARRR